MKAYRAADELTDIKIPEGVKRIEESAFDNCVGLASITLPEGLVSIPDGAFFECRSLKSITIPESVTAIGKDAFRACDGLLYAVCHSPHTVSQSVYPIYLGGPPPVQTGDVRGFRGGGPFRLGQQGVTCGQAMPRGRSRNKGSEDHADRQLL